MSGNSRKRTLTSPGQSPKGSQGKKSRTSGSQGAHLKHTNVTGWTPLTRHFQGDEQVADLARKVADLHVGIFYHTPETVKARGAPNLTHGMFIIQFTKTEGNDTLQIAIGRSTTMKSAVLGCRDGLEAYYGKKDTDELLKNIQESQQKGMRRSVTPKPQNAHPDATDKWYKLTEDFKEDKQLADLATNVAALDNILIFYHIAPEQFYPEDPSAPDGKKYKHPKMYTINFAKPKEDTFSNVATGQSMYMRDAALACRPGLIKQYDKEIVGRLFLNIPPEGPPSPGFDI